MVNRNTYKTEIRIEIIKKYYKFKKQAIDQAKKMSTLTYPVKGGEIKKNGYCMLKN